LFCECNLYFSQELYITSQWFGCFPRSAKFRLENGLSIRVDELKIGDRVLSQNLITGKMEFTPIVAFLHRDEHAWSPMLRVIYNAPMSNGKQNMSLYLTPDHLIYIKPGPTEQIKTVFASTLQQGSVIMISSMFPNQSLSEGIVLHTEYIDDPGGQGGSSNELIGLYAPLTHTGSVIVDDVVVSCFAYFSNPNLSYFITWPLQWMYKLSQWLSIFHPPAEEQNGIHWLAETLLDWLMPILPGSMFHPHT
uniref:HintN domain-containing protein n=1 Tax=Echinostoma caproni TaxID=27848 RepID=A0A183AKL8_9TREM